MQGSLSLIEGDKDHLQVLSSCEWELAQKGKVLQNAPSDKLPFEADRLLRAGKKTLSDLDFVAVGKGPGRWTGIRAGLSFARAVSFSLKIPIHPVNSLQVAAEPFLPSSTTKGHFPVFVSRNVFGGRICHACFHSQQDDGGEVQVSSFPVWQTYMEEKLRQSSAQSLLCVSDVGEFYPLSEKLKTLSFKPLKPKALHLAQIVLRQNKKGQNWHAKEGQVLYLKPPAEL